MADTYVEIVKELARTREEAKSHIEALEQQAVEIRKRELAGVIEDIKEKMDLYALTAEDLGFLSPKKARPKRRRKLASAGNGGNASAKDAKPPRARTNANGAHSVPAAT